MVTEVKDNTVHDHLRFTFINISITFVRILFCRNIAIYVNLVNWYASYVCYITFYNVLFIVLS